MRVVVVVCVISSLGFGGGGGGGRDGISTSLQISSENNHCVSIRVYNNRSHCGSPVFHAHLC